MSIVSINPLENSPKIVQHITPSKSPKFQNTISSKSTTPPQFLKYTHSSRANRFPGVPLPSHFGDSETKKASPASWNLEASNPRASMALSGGVIKFQLGEKGGGRGIGEKGKGKVFYPGRIRWRFCSRREITGIQVSADRVVPWRRDMVGVYR